MAKLGSKLSLRKKEDPLAIYDDITIGKYLNIGTCENIYYDITIGEYETILCVILLINKSS